MSANPRKQSTSVALKRWVLGPVIAGWALLMFSSAPDRGFVQSGVWQLEQTDAARQWWAGGGDSDEDGPTWEVLGDPRRGPLVGVVPAAMVRLFGIDDTMRAARLANMLLVCLTAWFLFTLGRRAGGALAGLAAAVTLICVPRVWAAATSPGLTAGTLFAMTAGAITLERGRDRGVWFLPSIALVAMAMLTTQIALLLVVPWLVLTFFDGRPSGEPGLMKSRTLTLWGPWVFPAGLALAALVPLWPDRGLGPMLEYARAFLERPREPSLYMGTLYAAERIPWHASVVLTGLTMPPTLVFLTAFGITAVSPLTSWFRRRFRPTRDREQTPESWDAVQVAWTMLLLTALIPLLVGTVHSHGVDLLALIVPWCAVFAGVGLRMVVEVIAVRLMGSTARPWARLPTLVLLTAFGWGVFVFALRDTQDAFPEVEGYYNWLVSGVDGAAGMGLPRNPMGPTPPHFLRGLVGESGAATVAMLPSDHQDPRILERYQLHGLVPEGISAAPLQTADIVVMAFDERSLAFYEQLPQFYETARSVDPERVSWLRREGIPFFGAIRMAR